MHLHPTNPSRPELSPGFALSRRLDGLEPSSSCSLCPPEHTSRSQPRAPSIAAAQLQARLAPEREIATHRSKLGLLSSAARASLPKCEVVRQKFYLEAFFWNACDLRDQQLRDPPQSNTRCVAGAKKTQCKSPKNSSRATGVLIDP